jgi:hypothetical protein
MLAALALAAAAAGCGDYSTEDIRFYEALPTRPDLRVEVPLSAAVAAGATAAVPACTIGSADPWLEARRTSDGINASVDWLVGLVDVVRRFPPTTRLDDGRIWGPFDDDRHPGVRITIRITRSTLADGTLEHVYQFEATRPAEPVPAVYTVLSGTFRGPSATHGQGSLMLDFEAIHRAGMQDADTPHGRMDVAYDRTVDPRAIGLEVATAGAFGLVQQFTYQFEGHQDGRGRFLYRFQKPAPGGGTDTLTVSASFAADGAGRGRMQFQAASGASGTFHQCWSAAACLTWLDDPAGYSCGGVVPCTAGAESACPAVDSPL